MKSRVLSDYFVTLLMRQELRLSRSISPKSLLPTFSWLRCTAKLLQFTVRFALPATSTAPEVERRMQRADTVTLDEYLEGLSWRARLRQSFERAFEFVDLIITPATGATAKVIGEVMIETGKGPAHYRSALSWFSAPVNHAGLPALVVPLAAAGAPPPAVQIMAPWWHEHRLLEFGAHLEASGLSNVKTPPDARKQPVNRR